MWGKTKHMLEGMMVIPAIATFYILDSKVISIRSTSGASMHPTIKENSVLVVDRFWYKLMGGIKKGDIVVSTQPVNPQTCICKRVVETGGNALEMYHGIEVPEGSVWLEGDNKSASYDSRHHGAVPMHLVQGKVLFVIPI